MVNKEIIFLSHTISEQTPCYGGKSSIQLKHDKSMSQGDHCNTMNWSFSNHIGTHVDAPLHFIEEGSSVTAIEPKDWFFNNVALADILDIEEGHIVGTAELGDIEDCDLLLIRTGFERYRQDEVYWQDSPGLDGEIALWLKKNCPSIKAVGVDFISISNLNNRELGRVAHKAFLENGILLIEDMKLSLLKKIPDQVIVAPLPVDNADGAPCTVYSICDK